MATSAESHPYATDMKEKETVTVTMTVRTTLTPPPPPPPTTTTTTSSPPPPPPTPLPISTSLPSSLPILIPTTTTPTSTLTSPSPTASPTTPAPTETTTTTTTINDSNIRAINNDSSVQLTKSTNSINNSTNEDAALHLVFESTPNFLHKNFIAPSDLLLGYCHLREMEYSSKEEVYEELLQNRQRRNQNAASMTKEQQDPYKFPIDEIPEPIKVLDNILSEFEDTSKPSAAAFSNGENQSEDDGYMSLSRKNMYKEGCEDTSHSSVAESSTPVEPEPISYLNSLSNPNIINTEMSVEQNIIQTTLPKVRPMTVNCRTNYSSLPCCGARSGSAENKMRFANKPEERIKLGIDINAVHNAVLRGELAKLPEPFLNEHPVTIYPGCRSSSPRDSNRGKRSKLRLISVEQHREVCQTFNPSSNLMSSSSSSSNSSNTNSGDQKPLDLSNSPLLQKIYKQNTDEENFSDDSIDAPIQPRGKPRGVAWEINFKSPVINTSSNSANRFNSDKKRIIVPLDVKVNKAITKKDNHISHKPLTKPFIESNHDQENKDEMSMLGKGTFVIRRWKKPPMAMEIFDSFSPSRANVPHPVESLKKQKKTFVDITNPKHKSLQSSKPNKSTPINYTSHTTPKTTTSKTTKNQIQSPIFHYQKKLPEVSNSSRIKPGLLEYQKKKLPKTAANQENKPSKETNGVHKKSDNGKCNPFYKRNIEINKSSFATHIPQRERLSLNFESPKPPISGIRQKEVHTPTEDYLKVLPKQQQCLRRKDDHLSIESISKDISSDDESSLEIVTNYDSKNLFPFKNNSNDYNEPRNSATTTPHTDLAPTLEEDEEQYSDLSFGCGPLRQIESNISALLRGEISVVRSADIAQQSGKRPLEFRPGVHKSESAKEMLLSQNAFGPLPPSPPSSNPDTFDYDGLPPLPPSPTNGSVDDESKSSVKGSCKRTTSVEIHSHSHSQTSMEDIKGRDKKSAVRYLSDELPLPPPPAPSHAFDNMPPAVPPHRSGHSANTMKSWSIDSNYKRKSPKMLGYAGSGITTPTGIHGAPTYDTASYGTKPRFVNYGTKRSLKQSPREEHRLQTSCSLPETPIFARGCDIPRTPFRRQPETNNVSSGSRTAPRSSTSHSINIGVNPYGTGMCRQRSMNHALASNEMLRMSGAPARGWYPKQRTMRPASTENIDRIASMRVWDGAAGMSGTGQSRKPLTLPPNLTPSFLNKSPREALRRVTSLLITKKKNTKERKNKPYSANTMEPNEIAFDFEIITAEKELKSNGNNAPPKPKKKSLFKSFWKRSKPVSLDQQ